MSISQFKEVVEFVQNHHSFVKWSSDEERKKEVELYPKLLEYGYNIKYVDYKDLDLIKRFLNPHARIMGSKKTATSARSQRQLSEAIKRARFMGLLPYLNK